VLVIFSGRESSGFWGVEAFKPYQTFRGLTFHTDRGRLKIFRTLLNLNLPHFYWDMRAFDASFFDLVITDFEPISSGIAKKHGIPSIGIGHQYAFFHDIPMDGANPISRFVLQHYAPVHINVGLHWHHFNHPIFPPIIPDHFGNNHANVEKKIIVYLPFENLDDILFTLKPFRRHDFFVYHRLDRNKDMGHIHLRTYSRSGFLKDLVESGGVICNAEFELPSEALYLGKNILVKPLFGQMEQLSNALVISSLRLGMVMKRLNKDSLAKFLESPAGAPIKYPNVARFIVKWIESGRWGDLLPLAKQTWEETL
jgi:uncharacterized protein (TIGR00661 family)